MAATKQPIIIDDGLYQSVPDAEYRRWAGPDGTMRLSKSIIGESYPRDDRPSMKRLKAAVDGKLDKPTTPAQAFGLAFEAALLEPARFKREYATSDDAPINPKTKKAYGVGTGAFDAWWAANGAGKLYLSQEDNDKIKAMRAAVMESDIVNMIREEGGVQASMAWTDDLTGIPMRGRADKIVYFRNCDVVLDVKTVGELNDRFIYNQVHAYGYGMQAALYMDGYLKLKGKHPDFLFVFVGKDYPYEVRVERLDAIDVEFGRKQYRNVLSHWKAAKESGVYPSAYTNIHHMEAGKWVEHEIKKFGGID